MAKAGDFKISVNSVRKTIDMEIVGSFTPEQVQQFVSEYQAKSRSVKASEYTLNVDSTDMDVLTQDMIPSMENTIRMYQASGFNQMIIKIKKSAILKMQLNRILKNSGFTNAEIQEI